MTKLNTLSEQLLLAVKKEENYDSILQELAAYNIQDVEVELFDDQRKNAFWINIYNAGFQILRKYKGLVQPGIYTKKQLSIAGHFLSLDDIEHGILRRYRYKYSLGYFPNPFIDSQVKKWAVSHVDFRIHFALNCGAVSCPPIAFYSVNHLEEQLEHASFAFLEHETYVDNQNKSLHVSRLFLWFLKDFEGFKGIRKILKKYLDQEFSNYSVKFNKYSWEDSLDNYDESRFDQI